MTDYTFSVQFVDADGRRAGGLVNIGCTEEEARQLCAAMGIAAGPLGVGFAFVAPWIEIKLERAEERTE